MTAEDDHDDVLDVSVTVQMASLSGTGGTERRRLQRPLLDGRPRTGSVLGEAREGVDAWVGESVVVAAAGGAVYRLQASCLALS